MVSCGRWKTSSLLEMAASKHSLPLSPSVIRVSGVALYLPSVRDLLILEVATPR